MKIVFATSNANKLEEVQSLLPKSIQLIGLADIGCTEDIPETADTIAGNALQKANYVIENYNLPCFADDTGLEVESLNGAPGVFSARYAGSDRNNDNNMAKLLFELQNETNRKAQFKTVIALVGVTKEAILLEGICKGEILQEKKGTKGFGYDPIFKPTGFKNTFAEMSIKEKNRISHRGLAVQKLIQFLTNIDK